jgi:TM2 domain-containing membrane protein YozV
LSVGRAPENDVVVDHPSVSRKHAEMVRNSDDSVDIFDRSSSVGTFVLHEGRWVRFEHATVGPEETIRLGDFETTPTLLLAAYRDPFDRVTERGPKAPRTRRQAKPAASKDAPAGPPDPKPPPGARPEPPQPPDPSQPKAPPPSRPEAPPRAAPATAPPTPAPTPSAPAEPPAAPPAPAPAPTQAAATGGGKSLLTAYLLWFFLGFFGAHRFYLGAIVTGIVQAAMAAVGAGLVAMAELTELWIIGVVPLTLLSLWWFADGFLTNDMVKKLGGSNTTAGRKSPPASG